jgi:hypothetical protein
LLPYCHGDLTSSRFLLAYLHLDSLIGKSSPKALRKTLDKLLTGTDAYDSAYKSAMERIESQVADRTELGKQCLAWIVHAHRTLTAFELQEMLGVEVGEHDLDRTNCPDVDDMLSACAGLVTVDESKQVIRLVHYTTQEYFDRTRQTWFPDAEAFIIVICTTYLSFDAYGANQGPKASNSSYSEPQGSSVNIYAARYWGLHAVRAPSTMSDVVAFLRRPRHVEMAAKTVTDYFQPETGLAMGAANTGLHMSAYFGLESSALAILEETHEPDPRNASDTTPLMFAASRGHKSVVLLLLAWNARADTVNRHGDTSLNLAVKGRHEDITRIFLTDHASANPITGGSDGPLHVASRCHSKTMVRLLLKAGADINLKGSSGSTPLHEACDRQGTAIAKLLTSAGADVGSQNDSK